MTSAGNDFVQDQLLHQCLMTFSLTAGVIRKENFAFAEMSCPVDHSHSEPRPAGTQRRATLQARCNQSLTEDRKRPAVTVSAPSSS